jgi:hypothetical protein
LSGQYELGIIGEVDRLSLEYFPLCRWGICPRGGVTAIVPPPERESRYSEACEAGRDTGLSARQAQVCHG